MNLPELYAAVVKKHPRLEVPGLQCDIDHSWWYWNDPADELAAALIADHWTESLPPEVAVAKTSNWYSVIKLVWETEDEGRDFEIMAEDETRLAALGAFWLAYEGEVK